MQAFHNDPLIKEKYLTRLTAHYKSDEIIKGTYWEDGKGCAVGCTIHSNYHKNYELELGIPKAIAHLQDRIFENLPNKLAKKFPLQFLSAIKVGADLKNVSKLFTIWVLTDSKYGVLQYVEDKKIVQDVADAISKDMVIPVSEEEWLKLKYNAHPASVYYAIATAYCAAASTSDSIVVSYAVAPYYAAAAYSIKNKKSEWYIAASKKLIELLKNAN